MKFVLTLAAAGVCVAAASGFQQAQPPATFSTGAKAVAVYATVHGVDGTLVPDLERDAFEVDDNGKKQALTLFANDIQPITVVMMLDRSGSMRANFELVEQAAEAFVSAMRPADKARIGSFSNRIQVDPRDVHVRPRGALKILHNDLQEEGPTPLWNAVNVGITALLHQQGRRVVLVFTDGVDNPMNFSSNNSSLKDVMKRADEEDVMVYAIGLAGHNGYGGRRRRLSRRRRPWRRGRLRPRRRRNGPRGSRADAAGLAAAVALPKTSPTRGCRRLPRRPAAATSS